MPDMTCKKLLIRGVNWIGDSVMTLPAVKALRTALPETEISLLVKPWVSPVFENNPHIHEIIPYDTQHQGFFGKLKLAGLLRKKHFCSTVLLQNAFDAALITFLAGIKDRIGYNRDGRGFLLTKPVPLPQTKNKVHQIYYYLNLLEQAGIHAEYSCPYLYLTPNERLQARTVLKNLKRPVLGINPGATYGSAKRWFPERFAEIASWFIQDTGGSVVIFGGTSELHIAEEIYRKMEIEKFGHYSYPLNFLSSHLVNMAGKTSLRELISLISECDVFVTNDSGPMHLAYAVRTPIVALFGSTDPVLTGPPPDGEGEGNIVITPDIPCSPCFGRTCKKKDMECMHAITSDDVYYGIKKILPDKPAVFFDRDGTLNEDTGYINRAEDFHLFEDIERLTLLKKRGFKLIGISNQSGIARGIVQEKFVNESNSLFIDKYGFDAFYYCPHHPDEHCPCRKPEPGMLLRARTEQGVDLKKSYIVGDKEADILLSKTVGAKGILVQTGKVQESPYADYIAKNLTEAVEWILRDTGYGSEIK
jgi:heptosyltransferase II